MEFRVNSESTTSNGRVVEVCIDDQWHETPSTAKSNNTQSSQDIFVMISADSSSESVMITWSTGQSIPNDNKIISGYDLSCTTSSLSDGQIHEVRVPNISRSTTKIQVHGLLPDMAYECCVHAHIHTNTPLDLISSSCHCVATSTESEKVSSRSIDLASGLGAGLGFLLLALFVGSIFINIFLIKRLAKKDQGMKVKFSSTNQ